MFWFEDLQKLSFKNRFVVYVIRRYFGRFFEQQVELNQVSINIINGIGVLNNIRLDVQTLNELSDQHNWPVEFLHGYIDQLEINLPWRSILCEPTTACVRGLALRIQPKERFETANTTFESMWNSMTSSIYLGEECIIESAGNDLDTSYEGIESFSDSVAQCLNRTQFSFVDTVITVEYLPKGSQTGVGIVIEVKLINCSDEPKVDPDKPDTPKTSKEEEYQAKMNQLYTSRTTHMEGITISTVEFSNRTNKASSSSMSSDSTNDPIASLLVASSSDDQKDVKNERNVIPFLRIEQEIKVIVRLRNAGEETDSKLIIESGVGSIALFLSPRQLHLLVELIQAFTRIASDADQLEQYPGNKPMTADDFARVSHELERHQWAGDYEIAKGNSWATGATDDGDLGEKFTSMASGGLYESAMSVTTMDSSITSATSLATTTRNQRKWTKSAEDQTIDITSFRLRMKTLSVVLLHEDVLTESPKNPLSLLPSSVKQMQRLADEFFDTYFQHLKELDLQSLNSAVDRSVKLNHLRFLADNVTLDGNETTTNKVVSMDFTIESQLLELSECLHQEERVQHMPLLAFTGVREEKGKSHLSVHFKRVETLTTRVSGKTITKEDLVATFEPCVVDFDITVMDRITAVLQPHPIWTPPSKVNVWAMSAPVPVEKRKIDVKVNSSNLIVKVRFPQPDFRPPHDLEKTPWWRRSVRADYLSLTLDRMCFTTELFNGETVQEYELRCHGLCVTYYDETNGDPIPIAKGTCDERAFSSIQNQFPEYRLTVKIQPAAQIEAESISASIQEQMTMSIGTDLHSQRLDNGPFSSKRTVHESDTPHENVQKVDSKELLVPGTKTEINDFIRKSTDSSMVQVDVFLPTLSMQLISKHLYEKIYNRINNDLLLWEPSAPKAKHPTPVYDDLRYVPFTVRESEGHDLYTLCESGIHYETESESDGNGDDSSTIFQSAYSTTMKSSEKQGSHDIKKQCSLSLNLHIKRGVLSMFTPVREASSVNNVIPGQQGEFLVNVQGANIFFVNGYMGDPHLGYLCLELRNAMLHHCEMRSTPSHSPPLRDIDSIRGKHLHPTIYQAQPGILANARNDGAGRDLVTLCLKIQKNHETQNAKNISIGMGFNKVTLRHRMCAGPNHWIQQMIDFFNVTDYPIPGYSAKEIITEMFFYFWDSSIDYRPMFLPLKAVITVGSFSISSHLSAEVNTSTLGFIAEECSLCISHKTEKSQYVVDLERDYVNVVQLSLFEISIKTTDKRNLEYPHFDLRASNNVIDIRTCADSAKSLTQLIIYLASYGDLMNGPEQISSAYSSPRHAPDQELIVVDGQEVVNLSESQHKQVNELLEDAVLEVTPEPRATVRAQLYSVNGTKMFYFPDEQLPDIAPLSLLTADLGAIPHISLNVEEDFCFIDQEAADVLPKSGLPEIRWLTEDPVRIIDNHFTVPQEKADPLNPPVSFPIPTTRYTLGEMSIIWHMYGGNDFVVNLKEQKKTVNFGDTTIVDAVGYSKTSKNEVELKTKKEVPSTRPKISWTIKGGPGRDHSVLMELQLSKIRFQHAVYPEHSAKASRQVLAIADVEIRDRLRCSEFNKFLYHYTTQQRPKQSNAHMVLIKALHVRPDPQLRVQECNLKVSLLPLRFNVDQDALQFMISYFCEIGSDVKEGEGSGLGSKQGTPVHQPPVMTVTEGVDEQAKVKKIIDENLLLLGDEKDEEETPIEQSTSSTNSTTEDTPIYFRNIIFSPEVPIRLDYRGKNFDLKTHGAVNGVLMGVIQLNCSELRLKRVSHRHGILGFQKLMSFLLKEWGNDVRKNQMPNVLVGVGPMQAFVQLYQGFRDLICLPFEQYKKDGRFFRGLHRGANSFTILTAMAALELTTRLILLIQVTAETAFDMLTPGPSVRMNHRTNDRRKRLQQPKDIREGITNAIKVVKEGLEETAENIVQVATHEHQQKGVAGAVGGVVRQLPGTIVVTPIVLVSKATHNFVGGVRSQLIPDARKEAHEKWRTDDTDATL